jgi:glycosyltransferase involved in cell wall biosynthesis
MLYSLLELGMQPDKLAREGDAVDLDAFGPIPRPEQTRKRFKLPSDVPVIGYAGQLESMKLSKGIPELLGAAEILSKKNVPFHLVIAGGPDAARKKFEKSLPKHVAEHVSFVGLLPATQVPHLLRACDCLVYPAPASNHPFYMRDTSPLKLFEYMAAKQPIVTADLPPIRDVLDDSMATFVPPGDPAALAEAIQQTIEHVEESEKKAKKAFETVQGYTWEKRMERIMQTFTSKELVSAVRSLQ